MQLLACCERPPFELSSQICRRFSLRQVTQLSSARPIPEGLLIDVNFGSAITIIPESPVPKRECLSNMLPGLGQKRVPQSVSPASGWVSTLVRSLPICVSSIQAPRGWVGSPGWVKTWSHSDTERSASSTALIASSIWRVRLVPDVSVRA